MNLKISLLSLLSVVFISTNCLAQDNIYKSDGTTIEAKVLEVGVQIIKYHRYDNVDGPVYSISKREVSKIVYENGTKDIFNGREAAARPSIRDQKKLNYGNNIIAVAPLQINEGIGVGLSYERVLDKNGIISFYLPITAAFSNGNNSSGLPIVNNSDNPYGESITTIYVMPGLKIYPTGSKGIVKYAIGPNIAFIKSRSYVYDVTYLGSSIVADNSSMRDRYTLGVMVTNSLNINPTEHIHIGMEMGVGISYFNQVDGKNTNEVGLFQLGFKVGYRF